MEDNRISTALDTSNFNNKTTREDRDWVVKSRTTRAELTGLDSAAVATQSWLSELIAGLQATRADTHRARECRCGSAELV